MTRAATQDERFDHARDLRKHDGADRDVRAASSHTPGPWKVTGRITQVKGCGVLWCGDVDPAFPEKYRGSVCRIQSADFLVKGITFDEAAANARLIAAAPDMLAALQNISRNAAISEAWLAPVYAAIAKATGGSQ